jgi:hypothetical protein
MEDRKGNTLDRRQLLIRTMPACGLACLASAGLPGVAAIAQEATQEAAGQEPHKFDVQNDLKLSRKQIVQLQNSSLFDFIRTLQTEMEYPELLRLLNANSANSGRRTGETQRANSPDGEFQTFVATFRPPRYANALTHEIVEDSEKVFELRVTECVWATVFREAGLDGEIGHAAVCNMDYYWPPAFNPDFKMERDQTLMQGDDCCNHRYIDTT